MPPTYHKQLAKQTASQIPFAPEVQNSLGNELVDSDNHVRIILIINAFLSLLMKTANG